MKFVYAAAAIWIGLGVLTYGTCIGRYDDMFPGWQDRHLGLVRRTCVIQAVFPLTGLPLTLATNDWRWHIAWR